MNFYKKLCSMLLLTASLSSVFAQKIDIDLEDIKVQYTRLPLKPFPEDFTTYSTTVSILDSELRSVGLTAAGLQKSHLAVPGYLAVPKGGHFHIELLGNGFQITSNTNKARVETSKNKEGKTVSTTYYDQVVRGSREVSIKITDHNQQIVEEKVFATKANEREVKKTWNSAEEQKRGNNGLIEEVRRTSMQIPLDQIRQHILNNYGWVEVKDTKEGQLEILDSKKHEDATAWTNSLVDAQKAFLSLKHDRGVDAVREMLKSPVEFWENGLKKYTAGDEKLEKLRHSCLYNLCAVNYWLDDFDKAEGYMLDMKKIDWQKDRTEDWEKAIAKAKADIARCNVKGRHPNREAIYKDAVAPDVVYRTVVLERQESSARAEARIEAITERFEGKIKDWAGKTTDVQVVVRNGPDLNFMSNGNITYKIDTTAKMGTRLDPERVQEFTFNGRTFKSLPFKTAADATNLGSVKKKRIMEVIFDSEKITVFKYCPHVVVSNEPSTSAEMAVQKKVGKDTDLQSTSTLGFMVNFKKRIAEYFEDCPELEKKCANGDFSNTESDLIQAAAFFTENCTVKGK